MHEIVGLLLAAGSARRFGGDKLLQHLPDGECVLGASAASLLAATDRCLALIRPDQASERMVLRKLGLGIVEVENAGAGMGVTLANGVRAAPDAAGWIVALADMPCVKVDTIQAVTQALRQGADIAAPFHLGRRGHPVAFAAHWFEALGALKDDIGARDILRQHADCITRIEVDDPGCLFDIDTPADLHAICSQTEQRRCRKQGIRAPASLRP